MSVVIGHPNHVDATFYSVSFSGGSWESTLPLTNLADPLLAKVARSADDATASTTFDIDLGVARPLRLFCIPKCNISRVGTIRIRGSNTAGDFTSPVYDSGTLDAWTTIYAFGSLPWGHPSFWDGKLDSESAVDYDVAFIHVASAVTGTARYWRWEITDTTNADGYVELARLFMAPGWVPTLGKLLGDSLGVETDTTVERSLGGVDYYDRQKPRRVMRLALAPLPVNEALSNAFEMQRRQGIDRQVFVVYDSDDAPNLHRRSFLATMRQLGPLEFPQHDRSATAYEFQEVL